MMCFDKMCRLCLDKDGILINLQARDRNNFDLIKKLEVCIPGLKSLECDEFPPWICLKCKRQLNECYKFNKKCFKSYNLLRSYVEQCNITTMDENCEIEISIPNVKSETEEEDEMQHSIVVNNDDFEAKIDEISQNIEINEIMNIKQEIDDEDYETQPYFEIYDSFNDVAIKKEYNANCLEPNISILESHDSIEFYTEVSNQKLTNSPKNKEEATLQVEQRDDLKLLIKKSVKKSPNNNENKLPDNSAKFECHICSRSYTIAVFLERHLKRAHGYVEGPSEPLEIEITPDASSENSTVARKKVRPKRHTCTICRKRFSDLSQLRIHHRVHTGERPFQCETCFKSFTQMQHLKLHRRSHTNEKPFTCDICHKTFSSYYVNVHRRIHTGETPFKCPLCEMSFGRSDKVALHMRLYHTGERPFLCIVCNKTFCDASNLRKHQLKHHAVPNNVA